MLTLGDGQPANGSGAQPESQRTEFKAFAPPLGEGAPDLPKVGEGMNSPGNHGREPTNN